MTPYSQDLRQWVLDTIERGDGSVRKVLAAELKPGDVVVWDNLKPHESDESIEAVEAAGARVVPLSPWSPDLKFRQFAGPSRRTGGPEHRECGSSECRQFSSPGRRRAGYNPRRLTEPWSPLAATEHRRIGDRPRTPSDSRVIHFLLMR